MKDRLKQIRKQKNLSQEQFANDLGVSLTNIKSYETNRRNPSSSFIQLVCNKYKVNETWLRTGEGEMFAPTTRNQAIAQKAAELFNNPELADIVLNTNANELKGSKARFIKFISALDDKRLDMVEQIMIEYVKNLEEEQKPPAD